MISLADYAEADALGLAALVARGEVTPDEVLAAALAAIAQVDPALNAVLQTFPDEAAAEIRAGLATGPFTGVPLLVKEYGLHARGVRCDMGSRLARGFVSPTDSELMARFRRAGLLLIGTTQTPEMAYSPVTKSVLHGATNNPWDPTRIAGGSSGGSAAAVAAGLVPVAYGNDAGGSIRVPASCCGVVGVKPTRDRVPAGPDSGDLLFGLGTEFVLTRTVRDAAAMLDAVAGADVGAPGLLPLPERPFLDEIRQPPRRLRVAWSTARASGAAIDPACVDAVQATVRLLAELGHELVEDAPRYDWQDFLRHTHVVFTSAIAATIDALAARLGRKPGPDNLEAVTLACYEAGKSCPATALVDALDWGNTLSRGIGRFFADVDLLLTPTVARLPLPLDALDQNRPGVGAVDWLESIFDFVAFTCPFNWSGHPAVSLPLHWTSDGLPVGVQLIARFADEATLLRVSAELEQARPWAGRRPPLHAAA